MIKTNPLNDDDMRDFVKQQKTFADSPNSWSVSVAALAKTSNGSYDLSVKNPNTPEVTPLRKPTEILQEIRDLDKDSAEILNSIGELI